MAKEALSLLDEISADARCNTKLAKRFAYEVNNYLCLTKDYLALLRILDISNGMGSKISVDKIDEIRETAAERKLARLLLMVQLENTKEKFLLSSHMRNQSIFMQFFADLEAYLNNTEPQDIRINLFDTRYFESEAFRKLR